MLTNHLNQKSAQFDGQMLPVGRQLSQSNRYLVFKWVALNQFINDLINLEASDEIMTAISRVCGAPDYELRGIDHIFLDLFK